MFLGMAYYPEHWPKERWPIDAQLMREAHIQAARMGEFAWSRFEPREGELHWEWMDEAIELLASYGIKTILCTPTATPPAWLVRKHPEIQPRDSNGLLSKPFGSRRHYCPNVEIYREYSRKITTAMAQHYGNNPNVIGWQIDNEMGNVYDLAKGRCYCESCRQAFIEWLKSRYDSLQALNEAWGTVFWSQEYSDWDEIVLPTRGTSGEGLNPSHVLAYYRFFSDSWASYTKLQADILREHARNQWISTNFAAGLPPDEYDTEEGAPYAAGAIWFPCIVDWRVLSESLDFPAWSSHVYGIPASLCADYLRGIRDDGNYAVLEGGGTRMRSYMPVARGARGLAPFRWRRPLFGAESGVE
ncbi:MAG: beta-galactosidase [Anaerolineae bacterium]|jgi:beta-galactosidase